MVHVNNPCPANPTICLASHKSLSSQLSLTQTFHLFFLVYNKNYYDLICTFYFHPQMHFLHPNAFTIFLRLTLIEFCAIFLCFCFNRNFAAYQCVNNFF